MAADSAGNDLSSAKIVVTSAYRFAPYDATKKLTADLIAPTVADVKTGLDKIFSTGGFRRPYHRGWRTAARPRRR